MALTERELYYKEKLEEQKQKERHRQYLLTLASFAGPEFTKVLEGALEEKEKLEDKVKEINIVELALLTGLAFIKDTSDIILALIAPAVAGWTFIIARIINFFFAIFLGLWIFFRFGGTFKTRLLIRVLIAWFLETLPLVGEISPTWTIFMFYLWWLRIKATNSETST